MTPDEVELLQGAGQVFIFNIGALVTESVLYGLYLAIFTFGIRALLRKTPWTKYTWTLFSFLSVLCLITTVGLATRVAANIELIRGSLVNNPEMSLINRLQLTDNLIAGLVTADIWLGSGGGGGFLFIFADAVVVWRAFLLWPGNKIARVFPLALLIASFGSVIVASMLDTVFSAGSGIVPTSSPTGVLVALSQSLSLATNLVATVLIGYKAYYHWQTTKDTIGTQHSRSGPILIFLTESGVAFCILQAIGLALNAADNDAFTALDYTTYVWQQVTLFAAVAYPALVLIIIDNHRSISDNIGGSAGDSEFTQGSNGIGSHLSFAAPPRDASSSGGGVSAESMVGSRVDPTTGVDSPNEGSVRARDLEKGEGLPVGDAVLLNQTEGC